MEITIFKEITTEGVLTSIEENSKKYHDGLYADMNNLPERTMVKKGAAEIGDIIKQLKTSRIAITKANTAAVNKEHDAIVARLEVANKPFTDLLDAYNVGRKKILDAEKARKQKVIDDCLYESDHEMGLLINKTFEYDRAEELRLQLCKDLIIKQEREDYAEEQVNLANERQKQSILDSLQREKNEENARLANKEHVQKVKTDIYNVLRTFELSDKDAKTVIHLATINELPNLIINY